MTPPGKSMDELLERLKAELPDIRFKAGKTFCWSPANRTVMYVAAATGPAAIYSLLHEAGHAVLGHKRYRLDFELLQLEVAAWDAAKRLARDYAIHIETDHIEDCLDTYRDWLYRRSICPSCSTKALQRDDGQLYGCHNCHATWRVSPSRFCRPYRQNATAAAPAAIIFAAQR